MSSDPYPHRRWPSRSHTSQPHSFEIELFGEGVDRRRFTDRQFAALARADVLTGTGLVPGRSGVSRWSGVPCRDLLRGVDLSQVDLVTVHSEGGYSTELQVEDFVAVDSLLALAVDDQPLSRSVGGPLRLVLPRSRSWKCAKWVRGIELTRCSAS